MESSALYHVKQQFILGAYKSLIDTPLPDANSPDYIPTLIYIARSHIALNSASDALALIPSSSDNVALKAVLALANYVSSPSESTLEELRDLAVEIESDDEGEGEGTEKDRALVRVLAGTAFAIAGEVEEALETLGSDTEDLEAVAVIVQIYLSIHRPDLAKKTFERIKNSAEDDLLLQLIESTIGLVTGKDGYKDSSSFYSEQLGNPSLSSPHLLTARGVTRLLRNEVQEAKSDLDEALEMNKGDAETLAALVVAAGLGAAKAEEREALWNQLVAEHSTHPMVLDVNAKSTLFDEAMTKFSVPPVAAK